MTEHGLSDLPRIGGLRLLPQDLLIRTGPVDHAAWNYKGMLGAIQRRRFRLILHLLGDERRERLLEVGYGSGVFAPELSLRCQHYFGLDVHDRADAVRQALAKVGVDAQLAPGSVVKMPFNDASMDCMVCVSVLEFVDDHDAACRELGRVLKHDGLLLVVTPGHSPLLDLGVRLLTGESAKRDFADRRQRIVPTLERHFETTRKLDYPLSLAPLGLHVYRAMMMRKLG